MNRGSVSMNAIVAIILVIAAFMIMFAVVSKVYEHIPDKQAGIACRATNVLRGNTQIDFDELGVKFTQSTIMSACKTFNRELTGTKKEIELAISEMATDCWWQWVNGYYKNLLCDEKGVSILNERCDNSVCYQCYTFSFSNIKPSGGSDTQSFNGVELANFMRREIRYYEDPKVKNDVNTKPADKVPVSYLDYIQYDSRGVISMGYEKDAPDLQALLGKFTFKTNTVYSIAYFEPYKDGRTIFDPNIGGGDDSALDKVSKPGILIQDLSSTAGKDVCKLNFGYQGN